MNEPSINDIKAYPERVTLMIYGSFTNDGADVSLSSAHPVAVGTILHLFELLKANLISDGGFEVDGDFIGDFDNE